MSKPITHKSVFVALFAAFIFTVAAFGQSGNLQSDLKLSFTKFTLLRLDSRAVFERVASGQSLMLQVGGKNYELNLTPHDLRPANYSAENATADGVFSLTKSAVTTFKGNIAGDENSQVRLTIDADKIEGYFSASNGDKFYIEPARKFSRAAGAKDFVVYRERDSLQNNGFVCQSELEGKIERGKEMVSASNSESVQNLKVIKLATDADFQFVGEVGNAAQADNEILSVLNMVEGSYSAELNLSISVVYQHTWSTPDSYDATSTNALLVSFQNYWNANLPAAQYPRDAAHLFTGKPNLSGLGIAYIGVVCSNPTAAYSLGGRTVSAPANNLITAHEIGHNLGAQHVDTAQNCASTIMNPFLSDTVPLTFCGYSRGEITNYVATNGSCLSDRNSSPACFDFDGDGKSDVSVFRPSNGTWYITDSANNSFDFKSFGAAADKLAPADYDGDGKTDIAVYRGGTWYRLKSTTNTFDGVAFGAAGDVPVPADFDGDGKADLAVFRPTDGVWHRLMSGDNSYSPVAFGAAGDVPVPADFDGDGKSDITVFRPSTGTWYRLNSSDGSFYAAQFGASGDKPFKADFDGDGKSDLAVFRPSNGGWYWLTSSTNSFGAVAFGFSTDVPVPADYDGDGKTDVAVFRPSAKTWYRLNSSNNSLSATQFGDAADVPIPSYYIQ